MFTRFYSVTAVIRLLGIISTVEYEINPIYTMSMQPAIYNATLMIITPVPTCNYSFAC